MISIKIMQLEVTYKIRNQFDIGFKCIKIMQLGVTYKVRNQFHILNATGAKLSQKRSKVTKCIGVQVSQQI